MAFTIIVKFIVYFCLSFIVQNNVIDKGKMPKYFTKYVAVFPSVIKSFNLVVFHTICFHRNHIYEQSYYEI